MAGNVIETQSPVASGAIAAYAAVQMDAAGTVSVCTDPTLAGGELFIGLNDHVVRATGDTSAIRLTGVGKALAGGVLTAGTHSLLMVGALGKLVAYVPSAANKFVALWIPTEGITSAADEDPIDVLVLGDINAAVAMAAGLIAIADGGGYYVATTVEAAFQELGGATGGAIIGLLDAGGFFVNPTAEGALQELGPALALRKATQTAGVEAGNAIQVTVQIVDMAGNPVAVETNVWVRHLDEDGLLTGSAKQYITASSIALSAVGAGIQELMLYTDVTGAATYTITDATTALVGLLYTYATPDIGVGDWGSVTFA